MSKVLNSFRPKPLKQSEYDHNHQKHIFDDDCLELTKKFLDNGTPVRKLPSVFSEMGMNFHPSTFYKHINSSLGMSLKMGDRYVIISLNFIN